MRILQQRIFRAALMTGVLVPLAVSQTTDSPLPNSDETTVSGTVVSSLKNTIIVRTGTKLHQLFIIDSDTIKPSTIPRGAEVTVQSVSLNEPDLRLARRVTLGGESLQPGQPAGQSDAAQQTSLIPASTRGLQSDIERRARKIAFGVRAGIGMDPEVILTGVHARLGPIFHRDISFRPSVEFGFGEVTKLVNVNLDAAYRLPITPRWSTWAMYLAAGPSLGFSQQNFERGNSGINWGNLEFTPGLNIVGGLESRRGFLVEGRATVYASPNPIFRLMFGYTF